MNLKFNIDVDFNKGQTIQLAKEVLFRCMVKMHQLAVNNAPVDTGRLKGSLNIYPSISGFSEYLLSDGVDYGIHVEYGTSPHYVSPDNLKRWSELKLGDPNLAYAVAQKILKFGTEAQPFMRPALMQVQNIWVERIWNDVWKKQSIKQ